MIRGNSFFQRRRPFLTLDQETIQPIALMNDRFKLRTTVFLACLVLFCLPACLPLEEEAPGETWLQEDAGGELPCTGSVNFGGSATEVSVAEYPGFDLAFALNWDAYEYPPHCSCGNMTLSFDLMFTLAHFDLIVSTSGPGDPQSPIFNSDPGEPGDFKTETSSFTLPPEGGNIVLVKFNPAAPFMGVTVEHLVTSVGGICILDNIPDPNAGSGSASNGSSEPNTGGG